ncbi:hypothetical protein PDJAM_G00163770 [Pangasius djambal]|uniref:Uncharacterized protein n=1 Tax=Pangasius djambal TaxID=1691987 RepID=A0ACC5ZKL5_9TELE|nr:hypothetical protein [Pangasius djambal]
MCTGRCSRFVAGALYPLAVISIICNIILFFPDWKVTYAKDGHLTEEVKYMGGLVGGGFMTRSRNVQNAHVNQFSSASMKRTFTVSESYLKNQDLWNLCTEPKGVVEFNIGLFSTLLVCSALQLVLCASQMINGLIGCICGACVEKGPL